jgi:DNA-binding HxlR family transcriptional regulator
MTSKRHYDDACASAHALELLGERWALLIVRELMLGGRRFSDLRAELPGVSANVLGQRLEELEARGVVQRRRLPPPARVQVYELTPWGHDVEPILQALARWAVRSPHRSPGLPISGVGLLLSFRTMFDPKRAKGAEAVIGFRFGEAGYLARIGRIGCEVARGEAGEGQCTFAGTPDAMAAAVYGGAPLTEFEATGSLAVTGDRGLARRFMTWFPLPQPLPL